MVTGLFYAQKLNALRGRVQKYMIFGYMVRVEGIEPSASAFQVRLSTNEIHPAERLRGGLGIRTPLSKSQFDVQTATLNPHLKRPFRVAGVDDV